MVVQCYTNNYFAEAIRIAFFEHVPLELTPDSVWLAIVQGFSQHIKCNAERLRHLFVNHDGQKQLVFTNPSLLLDSPPDVWANSLRMFTPLLENELKDKAKQLLGIKFSTTTLASEVATTIAFMDMLQHYFVYGLRGGCGIPKVILRGTPDDWARVQRGVEQLKGFDCDWWIRELELVIKHFVDAATGKPIDKMFWASACSYNGGSDTIVPISGWLATFFPYIKQSSSEPSSLDPNRPGRDMTIKLVCFRNSQILKLKDTDPILTLFLAAPTSCRKLCHNGRSIDPTSTPLSQSDIHDGATVNALSGTLELYAPSPHITCWRNPLQPGLNPLNVPTGMSSVPCFYEHIVTKEKTPLTLRGGFEYVVQDPVTRAVHAEIGWQVLKEAQ
jgi:hypothetical protein